MAKMERATPSSRGETAGTDDPLVRALDGPQTDAPTPWFIRQARRSDADNVLPMRTAIGSGDGDATAAAGRAAADPVATDTHDTIASPAARDTIAASGDRHEAPIAGVSFDGAPNAAAPRPRSFWSSRSGAALAVAIPVALLGWLASAVVPVPQLADRPLATAAAPRAPAAPPPRGVVDTPVSPPIEQRATLPLVAVPVTSTAQPIDVPRAASAAPVLDRSRARRSAVATRPATREARRALSVADAAPRRTSEQRDTPRRRAAVAASCSGIGRAGAWLVCARPRLAALDRELQRMSAQTLATGDPRAQRRLNKTSARFLVRRDRCHDASCIARLYESRLDAVSDYLSDGLKAAAKRNARLARARDR